MLVHVATPLHQSQKYVFVKALITAALFNNEAQIQNKRYGYHLHQNYLKKVFFCLGFYFILLFLCDFKTVTCLVFFLNLKVFPAIGIVWKQQLHKWTETNINTKLET